jgi:hypothetical protein
MLLVQVYETGSPQATGGPLDTFFLQVKFNEKKLWSI